jgi:hypothetical protein
MKFFPGGKKIKLFLLIFFISCCACGFAQSLYTRKQIKEMRYVKDVYKQLPDSAIHIYYEVMGKIGGATLHYIGKGDTLNDDAKLLMSTADLGSKIYFDLTYRLSSSTMVNAKSLSFKVVK